MGERRRPHPAPSLPARAATTPAGAAERRRQRARRQRVSEGSSRRAERDWAGEGRGSWSTGARRARRPGRLGAVAFGPAFRVKRRGAIGASVIARSTVQNWFQRIRRFSSEKVNQDGRVCYALKLAGTWWCMPPPRANRIGSKMLLTFRLNRREFTVWVRNSKNLRVTLWTRSGGCLGGAEGGLGGEDRETTGGGVCAAASGAARARPARADGAYTCACAPPRRPPSPR